MIKKRNGPTYDLDDLKKLLGKTDTRIITKSLRIYASSLGYANDQEIVERVQQLDQSEFDKTMKSTAKPGLMQDVYKSMEQGAELYIKLQKSFDGKAVIISFK